MRELNTIDYAKLTAELMAVIAGGMTENGNPLFVASVNRPELWGELHKASWWTIEALEGYIDTATAGELADAMATLAIAVKDCYQVAPDVYALYQWGYARVTDALDMPEVR
jgi:hypothetical protein